MKVTSGAGAYALTYQVQLMGNDVHILVYGGEAHIGSVSVADHGKLTTWVGKGHRDDALSEPLAKAVSEAFNCICSVSAGFHLDDLTKDQILQVVSNHQQGIERILELLQKIYSDDRKRDKHEHE